MGGDTLPWLSVSELWHRQSASPTPSQRAIALFWADGAGSVTPPGHWFQIAASLTARDGLTTPAAARVLVLLYMAEEAALSRLYAGIHYRSDNETGK